MATLGNNILVTCSDGTIYATKTHDITNSCETKEYADESSGRAKKYLAGRRDWSVSTTYLVGQGNIKIDLLKVGSTVTISIFERGKESTTKLTGTAIITQCHITATRGSLAQGAFSFLGSGALG